jgi:hypothetical protein
VDWVGFEPTTSAYQQIFQPTFSIKFTESITKLPLPSSPIIGSAILNDDIALAICHQKSSLQLDEFQR